MQKFVVLDNTLEANAKFILNDKKICDNLNTVGTLLKIIDLKALDDDIYYEIHPIVSENDYFNLWRMVHHNKHKDMLMEKVKNELEILKEDNYIIGHASYIEIKKEDNVLARGFVNYQLFKDYESQYLIESSKILKK